MWFCNEVAMRYLYQALVNLFIINELCASSLHRNRSASMSVSAMASVLSIVLNPSGERVLFNESMASIGEHSRV